MKGDPVALAPDARDTAKGRKAGVDGAARRGGTAGHGGAPDVSEVTLRSARAGEARRSPVGETPQEPEALSTQGSTRGADPSSSRRPTNRYDGMTPAARRMPTVVTSGGRSTRPPRSDARRPSHDGSGKMTETSGRTALRAQGRRAAAALGGRQPSGTRHPLVAVAIVLPLASVLTVVFGGWEAVVTQASSVVGMLGR